MTKPTPKPAVNRPRKVARKRKSDASSVPPYAAGSESAQPINVTEFTDNMTQAAKLWRQMSEELAQGWMKDPVISVGHSDTMIIGETFATLLSRLAANPRQIYSTQVGLMKDHLNLWHQTTYRLLGKPLDVESEVISDRRFRDDAWSESTYFDFLRRSYLINAQWMQNTLDKVEGLDKHTTNKLNFFLRQYVDALAPSNFLFTNPEVLRTMLASNGKNLVDGFENMLEDIRRGHGKLRISMSDENAFELGKNIAATPGSVVYEKDLMQLIQYEPSTPKVYSVPLLIILLAFLAPVLCLKFIFIN